MARINLEDSLWSDPRFMKLCVKLQDEEKALGRIIIAWRFAQKFWCPHKKPIPEKTWLEAHLGTELIEVGLAKKMPDGIYISGSEEQFAWWFQRQAAGRKGGLERSKRSLIDRLVPLSGFKQNVPSSSSSSSSSKKNKNNTAVFDLELVYQRYPKKEGKTPGLRKLKTQITRQEDYDNLILAVENYAVRQRGKDPQFVKTFKTFVSEWRDWIDIPPEKPTVQFGDESWGAAAGGMDKDEFCT